MSASRRELGAAASRGKETGSCVFCQRLEAERPTAENDLAVALPDTFPISMGHTLIIPRRHESNFFALSQAEQRAIYDLVLVVRPVLELEHGPDGYNLGLNVGTAAGQTVPHAHLHVIPRYEGDVADPRGGVRWILPARAAYWK